MTDNILEKIIELQKDQRKAEINPKELVNFLLSELNNREREVLNARYGLVEDNCQTLEAIGKKYGITRERVRQIENNALDKALVKQGKDEALAELASVVVKEINKGGYIRQEDNLFNDLLGNSAEFKVDKNCLKFIFSKFLTSQIEPVDILYTERAWQIKDRDLGYFPKLVDGIRNVLNQKNQPMHLSEILAELEKEIADEKLKGLISEIEDWQSAVDSYLEVSKHFKKNLFDKWGLAHWRSVNPKRMRDKIHLILQKYEKPLHYKQIAEHINQEQFDAKRAHPATIHNELILDDRYVLVGRGIYALAEWGYKPGVIAEVIRDILQGSGTALTKGEIMKEVLKRRMVKEGSVNLILSNRELFEKLSDGRYQVKA